MDFLKNQGIAIFTSKRLFFTMTCYIKKEPTSPIYHIKLLLWVISYAKFEFSAYNAFSVFANLGNTFGET